MLSNRESNSKKSLTRLKDLEMSSIQLNFEIEPDESGDTFRTILLVSILKFNLANWNLKKPVYLFIESLALTYTDDQRITSIQNLTDQ